MDQNKKRKKKAYYVQSKKAKNEFDLDSGMKGFFITCNNKENRAVSEAYRILNTYADNMYGPVEDDKSVKSQADDDDVEAALNTHVDSYKSKSISERRFQNMNTRTNNCIFIKTTFANPNEIIEKIFNDASEQQLAQSRFILRFLPVLGTCRLAEDKLEKLAEKVLEDYSKLNSPEHNFKYCIIHKIRCNNKLNKEIILSIMNKAVKRKFPNAKIDLNEPDIVFSIDILLKICCLSVLKKFHEYKKYNLFEMANIRHGAPEDNSAPSEIVDT